jgi:hypothetical protein
MCLFQSSVIISLLTLLFFSSGCSDTKQKQTAGADTNGTLLVIDGHRLPPEPDPQINNSSLLGIDSNNNGVRDDVERWIYTKYEDKHGIVREVAMQGARAAQIIIQEPERAKETMKFMDAATHCAVYFEMFADSKNEPLSIDHFVLGKEFDNIQFNTVQRARAYGEYNAALSGGVYDTPSSQEMKAACDFNVTELLKLQP